MQFLNRFSGTQKNLKPIYPSVHKNFFSSKRAENEKIYIPSSNSLKPFKIVSNDPHYSYCYTQFLWNRKSYSILGTGHGTKESEEHVKRFLDEVNPDVVLIELDPMFQELYISSSTPEEILNKFTRDLIVKYLKRKDYRLAFLAWAGFFAEACPFISTPELISASIYAQSKQIPWICADRAIEIGTKRWISTLSKWHLYMGGFNVWLHRLMNPEKPKPSIETLIKYDEETKGNLYPSLSMQTTIMTERDLHFIWKLKQIRESKIAVITGMGHVHGILKMWDEMIDLNLLLNVDNPQIISQGLKISSELGQKYLENSTKNQIKQK